MVVARESNVLQRYVMPAIASILFMPVLSTLLVALYCVEEPSGSGKTSLAADPACVGIDQVSS